MNLHRWWHTLRHLRPVQIWARPLHWLRRRFWAIGYPAALPQLAFQMRQALLPRVRPAFTWSFIGRTLTCPSHAIPWDATRRRRFVRAGVADPGAPIGGPLTDKLWRYQLNYFGFLFPRGRFTPEEERFLIADWLAANDDEHAEPWEPYVTARRIRNWVRWRQETGLAPIPATAGAPPFAPAAGASPLSLDTLVDMALWYHLKRLRLDLEHHLQGNHLLEDLAALCVGGCHLRETFSTHQFPTELPPSCAPFASFPMVRRARLAAWLRDAAAGLDEQVQSQILTDGAHEERSPMYHAEIMASLAQVHAALIRAASTSLPLSEPEQRLQSRLFETLPRMADWLAHLTHPDGRIALFQDSAFEEPPPEEPLAGASRSADAAPTLSPASGPAGEFWLADARYYVRRWGTGHYLAVDLGPPAPAHQPGHAHNSALSYELSVAGRRVVVDSGIGSYHDPAVRFGGRRTAAHNVPMTEGAEQSDLWGAFRMGGRAQVERLAHDPPTHRIEARLIDWQGNVFRRVITTTDHGLSIEDHRERAITHGAFLSLVHLAPGLTVRPGPTGEAAIVPADPALGGWAVQFASSQAWEVRGTTVWPTFGAGRPATLIRLQGTPSEVIRYAITWNP
ncbi:MAG: hypothetical protein OZSIB_1893 [Candidatus Ozemobacter sibiricus]|jgi:hypothetical protein|uniref:Uncharacterized protein n=1 Tax=Candidatus Ozemobacter sibiricus TaxID=2268124 RepID=A0A367ZIN2_9BACT|nr:MAG: hypothetical protein OZSIB_1893 [Candidatus Ozemobacter sibiricus]